MGRIVDGLIDENLDGKCIHLPEAVRYGLAKRLRGSADFAKDDSVGDVISTLQFEYCQRGLRNVEEHPPRTCSNDRDFFCEILLQQNLQGNIIQVLTRLN